MKGIRRKPEDPGVDPFKPRQLPSGRWVGCRHLKANGRLVGFNGKKAQEANDPVAGLVSHYHDH